MIGIFKIIMSYVGVYCVLGGVSISFKGKGAFKGFGD
jgi:hypothetical protein